MKDNELILKGELELTSLCTVCKGVRYLYRLSAAPGLDGARFFLTVTCGELTERAELGNALFAACERLCTAAQYTLSPIHLHEWVADGGNSCLDSNKKG